jgi:hypothetical protein
MTRRNIFAALTLGALGALGLGLGASGSTPVPESGCCCCTSCPCPQCDCCKDCGPCGQACGKPEAETP